MILNEKRIHYKLVALDQMIFLDMMLKEEQLCPSIKVILIEKSYIFHINFIFIQVHEKDYLFLRLVPLPSFETTAGTATTQYPRRVVAPYTVVQTTLTPTTIIAVSNGSIGIVLQN
jgi:hypothetical protein